MEDDLIRHIHKALGDDVQVLQVAASDGDLLRLRHGDAVALLHRARHGTEYERRLSLRHRWGTASWQFTLDYDDWPSERERHALARSTVAADRE